VAAAGLVTLTQTGTVTSDSLAHTTVNQTYTIQVTFDPSAVIPGGLSCQPGYTCYYLNSGSTAFSAAGFSFPYSNALGTASVLAIANDGSSLIITTGGTASNGDPASLSWHVNNFTVPGPSIPDPVASSQGFSGSEWNTTQVGTNKGGILGSPFNPATHAPIASTLTFTPSTGPLPSVGKNLGGPTAPVTPDDLPSSPANPVTPVNADAGTCPTAMYAAASDLVPTALVGEPINSAAGNVFAIETDFAGAVCTGLALRRYYNSQDPTSIGFGVGWRSAWQRSLISVAANIVSVTRADGRGDTFTLNAGVWQADPDVTSRLVPVLNAANQQSGWQLLTAADTVETYTLAGQLTSVTTRAGLTTTLAYNAGGQLTIVTGPFGATLMFANDAAGRIMRMIAPDGGTYAYGYDAKNNLISVSHPDGSVRQYLYANAAFPHALTGIVDENGATYAAWNYDTQGRAGSSQHAGGVDLTSVTYGNGMSSVTDANGNVHSYSLLTQFNRVKPASLGGAPYPPAGGQAFTYDDSGFVLSKTDYDGNLTTYTHDARGNQTSRIEAAGTALARTTKTMWLPNFNLPSSITEPGRITGFTYDVSGNLRQKTITAGALTRSWGYTYNTAGQVLTATDPLGHTTAYTYDGAGNLATITDALGHITSFTSYDPNGRPLRITDPNGLVTILMYNFRGQVTSRNAGGEITIYAYDPAGQLFKVTRPDGSYFTYAYDAAHRLTGIADSAGDRIALTYDRASNVIARQVFDPAGNLVRTRSYAYDAVNRLAKAIGAQGQTTDYAYDPNSNLTGITDPLSHVTAYSYDPLNRLMQAIDAKGGATDYGYDALDHLTGVTDPRDLTTSYLWDALDDQTGVNSPDSGATSRTFDAAGNVASSTDARGLTTTYQYDPLNRPVLAIYADGGTVTWQYDQGANGVGRLTTMIDLSGRTDWIYDQHGRVLTKAQATGGMTFTTAMSYDAAGRLMSVTYPSGAVITLSYDAAGRISGLSSGGAALVSGVTYFPFGPAAAWTQGNGSRYSRTFDQDGRIAGIGFGGSSIALAYDPASRITGMTETGLPNKTFGYDELDRLTGYTNGGTTLIYGYDPSGNRTSLGAGNTVTSYTIDPGSNRLLGSMDGGARKLGYDADGNVTVDSQPLVNFGYAYDDTGRLVTAKTGGFTTPYTNDGIGERVTRSGYGASSLPGGNQRFIYDQAGDLLGEYDGNGKSIQETVWLGDLPVAVLIPGTAPFYVAPDHLGSPHQIANAVGGTVWYWDHDPFGNGAPTGSLTYNLRFPGQYYNQETGLSYNGFRDYDPSTGRYVQSDPIGLEGGLNPYSYGAGNPVIRIDALGLAEDPLDPSEPVCEAEGRCHPQLNGGAGGVPEWLKAKPPTAEISNPECFSIPENRVSHIFRDAPGHILDTPVNRQLITEVANNPSALLGKDQWGNTWYAHIQPDGTQIWAEVRGSTIINGGVNQTPRQFNPSTGLSR
jgi:RHS repeat-associated protein